MWKLFPLNVKKLRHIWKGVKNVKSSHLISSHLSPLTLDFVGAPQMTLQQYLSILPCLSLPLGNLQTLFPSIPWCYLPTSSSVFLSFLLLSLWKVTLWQIRKDCRYTCKIVTPNISYLSQCIFSHDLCNTFSRLRYFFHITRRFLLRLWQSLRL